MNINRHNYEEFFLLYADNELPAEQRREVEDFVKQNTDLLEEFNFLNDLRLSPDTTIKFEHKESLLQPASLKDNSAQISDDQEKILRFIDLEMSLEEKSEFNQKLKQNQGLQQEFELFSKTKLRPDLSVVFQDKTTLYRSTKEVVRVIHMTWVRVAVAAAIILVAGLLWINNTVEETTGSGPLASVTASSNPNSKSAGIENNPEEENASNRNESQALNKQDLPDQKSAIVSAPIPNAVKANIKTQQDNRPAQHVRLKEDPPVLAAIDNPQRQTENIATPGNEQTLVNVSPNLARSNGIIDQPVTDANVKSNYATEALMSAQDEVEVLTLENNTRKGPIRGIVRKANRLLNKVTNPDPDKPLLRVANFEIALAK